MIDLTSIRPRVWWIEQWALSDDPDLVCVRHVAPEGTDMTTTKVHDSAYVDLLERIVERLYAATEVYATGDYSNCPSIGEYMSPMDVEEGDAARAALTAVQQMCEEFKGG